MVGRTGSSNVCRPTRTYAKQLFVAPLALLLVFSAANGQDPATVGQWSARTTWPYKAVHAALLPTGKVLWWPNGANGDNPYLWDPATNTNTAIAHVGANIFCAGFSFLADGTLLVAGGHINNFVGLPNAYLYNPFNSTWTRLPDMNNGRWYPTSTTLPSGNVLVVSGWINTSVGVNVEPQIWQTATSSWRNLSLAHLALPFYPFMFVAPNGKVFCAGPSQTSRYLDTSGSGAWSVVGDSNYGVRNWGSAVMYDAGKIVMMGGTPCEVYSRTCATVPTATAEVIDLTAANPTWRYTASLAGPRKLHNATLLPDGKVLVTGGSRGTEDPNTVSASPAYESEMWDPATGSWSTMASISVFRGYHTTALLLPDGRVLCADGQVGTGTVSAEIYSPPYLFKGTRPSITSVPPSISYGQLFFVGTPNATNIRNISMIALPCVTHGVNMGQRIFRPSFSLAAGGLNLAAPLNANVAPPGYYMLFILDPNGIPSKANIIQLRSAGSPTPTPTPTATPTPTPISTPTKPPPKPAAPGELKAVIVSASSINLSWQDKSNNEAGFNVERSSDGHIFTKVATVGSNVTGHTDTGLIKTITYSYRVSAFNSGGTSGYSNTVSMALTVPMAPTNLTATVEPNGQVKLAWHDHSNNESAFQIERSSDGITFVVIATTATNTPKYNDINAVAGQNYYRVTAKNKVGSSNYTNIATVVLNAPMAPTNLTATVEKNGQVTVKWADKSNNETGFQVERSKDGRVFTVIATTATNTTNYKDTTTVAGQRYYYRVAARNNVGLSGYSNIVIIP